MAGATRSPPRGAWAAGSVGMAAALWLLLAGAVAALGWLALEACGIGWAEGRPLLRFCVEPPSPDPRFAVLASVRAEEEALRSRLVELQRVLVTQPWCETPPPPPDDDPPAAEPPDDVAALTETPPAPGIPGRRPEPPPLPDPPPAPPPPAAPPEPPADIPEQAWNNRDLSVMEGCWRLVSDYQIFRFDTMEPRSVTRWQMCFGANGFGSQQIVMDDGTVCSMGVRAQFLPDGRMRLADPADTTCSDGTVLVRRTDIDCARRPDGTAHCRYIRPVLGWSVEIALRR